MSRWHQKLSKDLQHVLRRVVSDAQRNLYARAQNPRLKQMEKDHTAFTP